MAKFFVSYSRSVKDEVKKVIELLRVNGHEVWWDGDIPIMADWWATILKNIEWCDTFIFVTSEKSVQSAYCIAELKYANDRQRPILPFVIDDPTQYALPSELPPRAQWLIYNNDPEQMLAKINHAVGEINWALHRDIDVPRPPGPMTGGQSLTKQFQNAVHLANQGQLAESRQLLRNVKSLDYGEWGDLCDRWIEQLNRYSIILDLADDTSTLHRARKYWQTYLNDYGHEFDPQNIGATLSGKKSTNIPFIPIIGIILVILVIVIAGLTLTNSGNEPNGTPTPRQLANVTDNASGSIDSALSEADARETGAAQAYATLTALAPTNTPTITPTPTNTRVSSSDIQKTAQAEIFATETSAVQTQAIIAQETQNVVLTERFIAGSTATYIAQLSLTPPMTSTPTSTPLPTVVDSSSNTNIVYQSTVSELAQIIQLSGDPQLISNSCNVIEKMRVQYVSYMMTGAFEGTGYATYHNYDAGIISYGLVSSTMAAGSMVTIVQQYLENSTTDVANQLREYLPRIEARDESLRNDENLKNLLIAAADEVAMQEAQHSMVDERYWDKIVEGYIEPRSLQYPLSYAFLFDIGINFGMGHGFVRVAEQELGVPSQSSPGVNGITEEELITRVGELRKASHDEQAGDLGFPGLAERGDFWVKLLNLGDWYLQGDSEGFITVDEQSIQVRDPWGVGMPLQACPEVFPVDYSNFSSDPIVGNVVYARQPENCYGIALIESGSNIRPGPGTSTGSSISRVPYLAQFTILGSEPSQDPNDPSQWMQIEYNGQTGWIREDQIAQAGSCVLDRYNAPVASYSWVRGFNLDSNFNPVLHHGWDMQGEVGEPIYGGPNGGEVIERAYCEKCGEEGLSSIDEGFSVADNRVLSDPGWNYGYGHYVIVRYHNDLLPETTQMMLASMGKDGWHISVIYSRLHSMEVEQGEEFEPNFVIATLGNSGNSTGPHLHLEVRAHQDPDETSWAQMKSGLMNPGILFSRLPHGWTDE